MPISDDDLLLEFLDDAERMAEARRRLDEHGDAYRHQLVAAIRLTHQAAHLEELRAGDQLGTEADRLVGYVEALRHVADNLRSGDYLPGSTSYEETVAGNAS